MSAEDAIRDHLPSLWRFEKGARGLLPDLVREAARGLSLARVDAANTMQAHWSRFADYAPIAPYVSAFRQDANLAPLLPNDADVELHPYLDDLARLAGIIGLSPYADPSSARETVEAFRRRLLGTIDLWRNGVSTRAALLRATHLALSGTDERAVTVEEFAPATPLSANIQTRGQPVGLVGPLMRWQVEAHALKDVPPELFITGVEPIPDRIDATESPMIERFDPDTGTGIGILYDGSIAPDQTLAILPTFSSWLGSETGIRTALSEPGPNPANPTAPGPWAGASGGPTARCVDMVTAADGALWSVVNDDGEGQIWSLTSAGWTQAFAGLPTLNCLFVDGSDLLVGHANGLARLSVFAAAAAMTPDPTTSTDPSVNSVSKGYDGTIWLATSDGAATLGTNDALVAVGPGARPQTQTPLAVVLAEADGIVTFGGELGLFRYNTAVGNWHIYVGDSLDETIADWQPWDEIADNLPNAADIFLPPVTCLTRGPDTLLWIGTERGVATWGAHRQRRTYSTRTRAFPAIIDARINTIKTDARGRVWFGTERGLFVHDGMDWFEDAGDGLVRLERLPNEDIASGWRFDRTANTWQFADAPGTGFSAQAPALVTTDGETVTAIHWTDGAVARMGTRTDGVFQENPDVPVADLRLRVKPTADRIIENGIASIPRLSTGTSHWRYLREEEASPPTPTHTPAWTREGRLLTPPEAHSAPYEGRFLTPEERIDFDQVFAFNPSAKVDFVWRPHAAFSITIRLYQNDPQETLSGAVLDRIHEAADRVRPAGARVRLALGETIVRGDDNG